MNESTTTTAQDKGPLEHCAELATWHQLETDPAQKERIAAELAGHVFQALLELFDEIQRILTRHCFNAPDACGHTAFRNNLEQADITCAPHVCAAAEFD